MPVVKRSMSPIWACWRQPTSISGTRPFPVRRPWSRRNGTLRPSPLKSVGLHKLKGDRRGQWAMTVNDRWRICFEFRKGDAYDVEIVDYHRG